MENLRNDDVREWISMERNKNILELSEVIFHDFKNIMATISGLTELSLITDEVEELKKYANKIKAATLDMNNALSIYYGHTAGYEDQTYRPSPVYKIMREAVEMVKHRLACGSNSNRNIKLSVNILSTSKVMCKEYDLKQCFLNLIMNSLDSMEKFGGVLTINIYNDKDEDDILIEIEDTGEGISEENLLKIFNTGFTTKEKGTGLGLRIVKNYVERLNGSINVSSKLGVGTKARIRLPIYSEQH